MINGTAVQLTHKTRNLMIPTHHSFLVLISDQNLEYWSQYVVSESVGSERKNSTGLLKYFHD